MWRCLCQPIGYDRNGLAAVGKWLIHRLGPSDSRWRFAISTQNYQPFYGWIYQRLLNYMFFLLRIGLVGVYKAHRHPFYKQPHYNDYRQLPHNWTAGLVPACSPVGNMTMEMLFRRKGKGGRGRTVARLTNGGDQEKPRLKLWTVGLGPGDTETKSELAKDYYSR